MRARLPVLLILVCLAVTLAAQERAVIVVTVTDDSNGVLPGATVTLTGPSSHTCLTDVKGECTFVGVLPGSYLMQSALLGFTTFSQRITAHNGQTLRFKAAMSIGTLAETVTVTGQSPLLDSYTTYATAADQRERRPRRNTESYTDPGENAFQRASADPVSTFSVDVDTASYTNMRRFLNDGQAPPTEAIRIEELINYFHYQYPQPKGGQPFSVTTELAQCPWNSEHRLALIGLQGKTVEPKEVPDRNLVFLVDVSGSMMEPDKLSLVRYGLRMLAATLRPNDRVAVVVYAGASGLALPATGGDQKAVIDRAIAALEAGGSTNGAEGIRLAYDVARENFIKGGVNRVILATDGDFNVGITSPEELTRLIEHERESGVFLSVLGVGEGNLKDSTMEMLADKGNGNYSYLDSAYEARRVLVEEAGSTLVTIAKDVKIQVEFNPSLVSEYRLIGYENRMLEDEDFEDDRKDAGEIGAGHSVTAIYEVVPASVDAGRLMTVKLRYKEPDGEKSKAMSAVMFNWMQPMSANLGFASAIAEAGMLLRNSRHVKGGSLTAAIARAKKFRGADTAGYRAEFIRLMELASTLPVASSQ